MDNSKDLGKKKIKDEDLGTVSGGCGKKKPEPEDAYITRLECKECSHWEARDGDHRGALYNCPNCGRMTLRGVRLIRRPH